MYFLLSKLLLIFILPYLWFLFFFIAGLIVKKPKLKRRFLLIAAAILLIFTNPYLLDQVANAWDVKPVKLEPGNYSCAIVLGGFAGADANGKGVFNGSADRFIQGLKLVTTGKASHILISGGNGNLMPGKFEEADWVRGQLKLLKVPDSCILIEDRSRNTIENAAFSKGILEHARLRPPWLLITSAFHMRRAMLIFKKQNLTVTPYPCNYMAGNKKISADEFIPDAGVFASWNTYIKEFVGFAVDYFK